MIYRNYVHPANLGHKHYSNLVPVVMLQDCIICEQENMFLGDPLDGLNEQIQEQIKNDGPFDVMIILKEKL